MAGYQPLKVLNNSPSSTRTRSCNNRWAPAGVHRICCCLHIRLWAKRKGFRGLTSAAGEARAIDFQLAKHGAYHDAPMIFEPLLLLTVLTTLTLIHTDFGLLGDHGFLAFT